MLTLMSVVITWTVCSVDQRGVQSTANSQGPGPLHPVTIAPGVEHEASRARLGPAASQGTPAVTPARADRGKTRQDSGSRKVWFWLGQQGGQ